MEPADLFASAIRLAADDSADSNEYWGLIRALHRTPEQRVFELAAALCVAPTAAERVVGADVLAQLGTPLDWNDKSTRPFTEHSAPILRELLHDADNDVLTSAIHALGHHDIAAATDLRSLAGHSSAEVRRSVAFSLDPNEPDAQMTLLRLMEDEADAVRDWATFAIGSGTDDDNAIIRKALENRLDDRDDGARGEALVGLARRGDTSVRERIIAELEVKEPTILALDAAQDFLERYPDEPAVAAALASAQARL